jgi:xylulokinase
VLDVPIERVVVEEGSALGAALLGGVAGGVFGDIHEAMARTIRIREVVEPDPAWVGTYAELHGLYRGLYPALRPFGGTVAG